jgi:hypothetical protein
MGRKRGSKPQNPDASIKPVDDPFHLSALATVP